MLRKIFDVIQPDRGTSVASQLFDYFITTLSLLSVACVYVTIFDVSPPFRHPITMSGRLFGTLTALLGIGMVAIPTGIISSRLMEQISDEEEKKEESFKYCPHCGKKLKD